MNAGGNKTMQSSSTANTISRGKEETADGHPFQRAAHYLDNGAELEESIIEVQNRWYAMLFGAARVL